MGFAWIKANPIFVSVVVQNRQRNLLDIVHYIESA